MPPPIAASEVHIGSDIRLTMRALLAAHESTRRMAPPTPALDAYNQGFIEATILIAEALNIDVGIRLPRHYSDRGW